MTVIIGIDPHKASHAVVAIDCDEHSLAEIRVRATCQQTEKLLAYAGPFGPRTWAVESAGGMGYLLSQQLVSSGEEVLDVPATYFTIGMPRVPVEFGESCSLPTRPQLRDC